MLLIEWTRLRRLSVALAISASLAACGGGGDGGGSDMHNVEGAYEGSLSGSPSSTAFRLLVLENGEYWSIYGNESHGAFSVLGFIQGSGAASAGNFSSNNARDFVRSFPSVSGSVTAAYSLDPRRISGRVTNSSGSVQFAGQAIPPSAYDYHRAASISTIQGPWTLRNLLGESMTLTVDTSGSFAATTSTLCALTGTVMPRASGKNVFNVEFRFGGAPCLLPNQTGRGIAVAYRLADGRTQLLVAAVDGDRTYGSAAFGAR